MSHVRRAPFLLAACLALAAVPAPAAEVAIEGQAGYRGLAFKDTAQALLGKTGGGTFGGALRVTVWRGLFVSAGYRTFSADGERVFLASRGAPPQKLGFPLSLKLTDIPLTIGYRLRQGKAIVPYLTAGAVITKYAETSSVAGESFDQSVSKTGFIGGAGVELRLVHSGLVRVAGEAGYSSVGSAIGTAGVSKVLSEDNIGGAYAVGKLVIAFSVGGRN